MASIFRQNMIKNAKRNIGTKLSLTFIETFCFCFQQLSPFTAGYVGTSNITGHLSFCFFHANIFHLLVNLLCLWSIRGKMNIPIAYAVSVLASFSPQFTHEHTTGLSGLLFAAFGIMWGEHSTFRTMCKACAPAILIAVFLPHVNGLLHLWCLLGGFLAGIIRRRLCSTR